VSMRARETPETPTVVYDGDCSFCKIWVGRLARWDREDSLRLLPLQEGSAERLTGRSAEQLRHSLHFVETDGTMLTGAAAVREALLYTRWKYLVKMLASVPGTMFIAETIYRRVAESRNILGCDGVTCNKDVRGGQP